MGWVPPFEFCENYNSLMNIFSTLIVHDSIFVIKSYMSRNSSKYTKEIISIIIENILATLPYIFNNYCYYFLLV